MLNHRLLALLLLKKSIELLRNHQLVIFWTIALIFRPIDGVVPTRSVEPGRVVLPRCSVLRIVDLNQVYPRGFIAEQVFGVKLSLDQLGGFAKPGMPADAEIFLQQEKAVKAKAKTSG